MLPLDQTRPFSLNPREIDAGMLLSEFEERVESDHILAELEILLEQNLIPYGGIKTDQTAEFIHNLNIAHPLHNGTIEVIKMGLFDPELKITSDADCEHRGKIIADTASEVLIGLTMDHIYQNDKSSGNLHSIADLEGDIDDFIRLNPSSDRKGNIPNWKYLNDCEVVFITLLRNMLRNNLKYTLENVESYDDLNPYKILARNLVSATTGLFNTSYDFIERGIISMTNNLWALVETIPKLVVRDLQSEALNNLSGAITVDELLTIFDDSRSSLLRGLAKNDLDIFAEMVVDSRYSVIGNREKVEDGILSKGRFISKLQGDIAPFSYDIDQLKLVKLNREGSIAMVVLKDVDSVVDEARKKAFQLQLSHPDLARLESPAHPINTCPARVRRAHGKPNAIKYIHHEIATRCLKKLNQHYRNI